MYRFLKQYFLKSARRGQWHTFKGISLETLFIYGRVWNGPMLYKNRLTGFRHMAKNGTVMVYKIDCIKPE